MANVKHYFDLHIHPSLKPFRYNPKRSIWKNIPDTNDPSHCDDIPSLAKGAIKDVRSDAQSNLIKCRNSRTRVLCISLYPVERGMFNLRKLLAALFKDRKEVNLGACMTSIERPTIQSYYDEIKDNKPVDYCAELFAEYQFFVDQMNNNTSDQKMIIAEDYASIKKTLETDESSVVVVMTIEGMHSLLKYNAFKELIAFDSFVNQPGHPAFEQYKEMLISSIETIKRWGNGKHAPLFITFAHHFWNLMSGHAKSFGGIIGKCALNQICGLNLGITELGHVALAQLLSRTNGRRILIDVKHMSARARKVFISVISISIFFINNFI
ncbi:MAG: hypothetical protein AAGK97_11905 [Bacteroidota bacterium]